MSLSEYRRKRDFKATPEPKAAAAKTKGNSFVIQKHAARRLHYDLRLEMNGVLRSWAVTRGPSLVPAEKRLAVHVEDHPLAYGDFEGVIPPGQYGSGEVIVWDRGTWIPLHDPAKGYKKGHLEFTLTGEKLQGHWHLVRMAGRDGDTRENWLLIKGDDEFARTADDADITEALPLSVKSGRPIESLKGDGKAKVWNSRESKAKTRTRVNRDTGKGSTAKASSQNRAREGIKGSKPGDLPDFVPPALATLVKTVPKGARWLHEIKLDGYRMQARIEHGSVKLLTRTGLDWTERFGEAISQALKSLPAQTALLDGEIVVETGNGSSDFSLLQADLSDGRSDRFVYYVFDLLHLDGQDLTGATLIDRKARLEPLLDAAEGPLKYSAHFDESGDLVLKHACRLSLEGIISKVADAPYHSGRGRDWVKSKCTSRQELVIGGYVPSSVSDKAIGSLIMGVNDKDGLRHVGRVGTGYSQSVARELFKRLQPIARATSPFAGQLTALERKDAVFVSPELVAEVEFRGWTGDAHLRHASYRGLREDKEASEVIQESGPTPDGKQASKRRARAEATAKRSVPLTHPDRLYWPEAGVTKEGLADYYIQVWPRMAPFIVDRPLALLRCPEGHSGTCFFQKHGWRGMRKEIITIRDPKDEDEQTLVGIHDLDGLLALVQGAALEIHPWGSRGGDLERPDMVNIDLDPGPDVSWERVIKAAFEVRQRFADMGLTGFVKTSGGKGLHVVAPVKPKAEWPAVKAAMKGLADSMALDSPEDYVATISKAKRQGKILIDYLRNGRGNTAVAPYSTRARDGAPVSMPLSFDELGPGIGPNHFTVENTPGRLESLDSDPWADFRKAEAPITTSTSKGRRKR